VVADGFTVTAVPLVAVPTPPIVPVPPLNTAVSVVAPAVKLVITGAGTTATVAAIVTAVPVVGVTVRVYVVVAEGVTVTAVPLVTVPVTPLIIPLPPLNTAVSVVDFPAVTVAAPAEKLVIAGGGVAAAGLRVDIAVEKVLLLPTPLVLSPVK
jgi:hypothetical protein